MCMLLLFWISWVTPYKIMSFGDPDLSNVFWTVHICSLSLPSPHHFLSSFFLPKIRIAQNTFGLSGLPTAPKNSSLSISLEIWKSKNNKLVLILGSSDGLFGHGSAILVMHRNFSFPDKLCKIGVKRTPEKALKFEKLGNRKIKFTGGFSFFLRS